MEKIEKELKYRTADQEMIPQLVKMREEFIVCDEGEISADDLKAMEKQLPVYFAKHLGHDLIAYTAMDEDRIIACAFLLIIEKPANPHFIHGRVGEIYNVYTIPEYQHHGIASELIRQIIVYAEGHELDRIDLAATEQGYGVYEKLGFIKKKEAYQEMRYVCRRIH
ncbi:MAG: GNAT family N-acetyltransferase [Solobacterium sp.]|jgi:ribosomal protein S18 acetylase RimI-like enzyme|nr:GNAT family N-acetyltransferase [Solobacterium sp.]MCH4204974.1 GNAT family N-acetyltransferase [Solobacterium sp.]MCH4226366.1 GNAT family N-acetyltransferase [Solobacterium sp.]MCH4281767.1 GNAT family N-acetyltransferase [Solobacterium sp.]